MSYELHVCTVYVTEAIITIRHKSIKETNHMIFARLFSFYFLYIFISFFLLYLHYINIFF